MARIHEIKAVQTKAGAVRILVSTAEQDVWIPLGQWNNKCKSPLDSYVGGEIHPNFYQEGEEMTNGDKCTASDKVLNDFTASVNPEVAAIAQATIAQKQMEKLNDANALFIRKRNEAAAAAKAAALAAESEVQKV